MKRFGILCGCLVFTFFSYASSVGDSIDTITGHIKTANTKELARYFSSSVTMALLKDEGVYSKVQAEIILREFFNRYTPKDVTCVHRLERNPNFRYVVLNMRTDERSFRVSFKLTSETDSFKITELRIE